MHRPPRLISELLALAKTWGWTVEDLARELEMHRTTLLHQRAGRHALTTAMLSRVARRFKADRSVRDLIWNYLTVEYQEHNQRGTGTDLPRVAARVTTTLTAYLDRFAEESVHGGRGLYLLAGDASLLSETVRWLQNSFTERRITAVTVRADRPVAASEGRLALAAPLLLVERIDFLKEPVADLLRRRADLVRPVIVSSMQAPSALSDPYLRRILNSTNRVVELSPSGTSSTPYHGPVPAATEQ